MTRYLIVAAGSGISEDVIDDRMADSPADAVRLYSADAGDGPWWDFHTHPPAHKHRLRHSNVFEVFEIPGEVLENFHRDECSPRFIRSLFKPVALVEGIERSHHD